jgi:tripartite-type tricarboxylate transporter receptor subunit TctC
MVIAFPPGGSNDMIAHFVGVRLTSKLGQQIVYDYRGGAAGMIGTEIVARAVPGGYTILFASTSHTMIEAIRKAPYETLGSFAPVAMLGRGPNVLVAHPGLPAKTFAELIPLAKANPGKFKYASTGIVGINTILRDPDAAKQLAAEGAEVTAWTPAQFGVLLADTFNQWKRVARDANIRAE